MDSHEGVNIPWGMPTAECGSSKWDRVLSRSVYLLKPMEERKSTKDEFETET
jgi:hypothetical protein